MGRLTKALADAHVRHTAELYVGAQHGWTQTDTPAYDEPSAERHWMRLLELLDRVLLAQVANALRARLAAAACGRPGRCR